MTHFDEWWNSAEADSFRSKHEDLDGEVFRTVWDAATQSAAQADALDVLNSLTRYTVGRRGNGPMYTFAHPEGPYLRYSEFVAVMTKGVRNGNHTL